MLRDDMGILKKEMQSTRAEVSDAITITGNIDSRFHTLESEMRGFWAKMKDDETARADDTAANQATAAAVSPQSAIR